MVSTLFSLTGAFQRRKVICHGYEFTFDVGFLLREPGRLLLYGTDAKPVKFSVKREYHRPARICSVGCTNELHVLVGGNPGKPPAHRAGPGAPPPIDSLVAEGYSSDNGSSRHFGCECSVGFHLQRESASRNWPCYDAPRGSNASNHRQPVAVQARPREGSRQRSSRVRPDSFPR
jgi:hypothetical protein